MAAGQKKTPSERLEGLERWSGWATLLILGGIVLEIGNLFWFPHHETNWELASSIVALLAIGIGLAVEYLCIVATVKASKEEKLESDARLTEAINRAVRTEQQLIDLKTPRRQLFDGRMAEFSAALRTFSGTIFDIGMGPNDGEVEDFIWNIEPALWDAGWQQIDWKYPSGILGELSTGGFAARRPAKAGVAASNVLIQVNRPELVADVAAANALAGTLNGMGIEAHVVGFNIHNGNTNAIHILIGPKR